MSYSACVGYILMKRNKYELMPRLEREMCSLEVVTSKKKFPMQLRARGTLISGNTQARRK